MSKGSTSFIALLRGINVTGRNMIPMADLRALCTKLGWDGVQTYIQSGNVVFRADGTAAALEAELEKAITRRFGFDIPVVMRTASDWERHIKSNPFSKASESEPHWVLLVLPKAPPKADAAAALQQRATKGEIVVQAGNALWIHFKGGVGESKLSPAVLDRLIGSAATARNWRTVLKLREMAAADAPAK